MPELSIESIDFASPWAMLLIVLAAMIQDDLTCLVVASAVAAGEAEPLPAAAACLTGIFLGDIAWFLSARLIGQRMLSLWPFRVIISEERLQRARERFEQMGGERTLFASRFLPLLRTPLQVATGLLVRSALPGCLTLLVAGLIYVTLFIGTAATVGQFDIVRDFYQRYGAVALLAVPVVIWGSLALARALWPKKPRTGS